MKFISQQVTKPGDFIVFDHNTRLKRVMWIETSERDSFTPDLINIESIEGVRFDKSNSFDNTITVERVTLHDSSLVSQIKFKMKSGAEYYWRYFLLEDYLNDVERVTNLLQEL